MAMNELSIRRTPMKNRLLDPYSVRGIVPLPRPFLKGFDGDQSKGRPSWQHGMPLEQLEIADRLMNAALLGEHDAAVAWNAMADGYQAPQKGS